MEEQNLATMEEEPIPKKDYREILAEYQSEIDDVIKELRGE